MVRRNSGKGFEPEGKMERRDSGKGQKRRQQISETRSSKEDDDAVKSGQLALSFSREDIQRKSSAYSKSQKRKQRKALEWPDDVNDNRVSETGETYHTGPPAQAKECDDGVIRMRKKRKNHKDRRAKELAAKKAKEKLEDDESADADNSD